jgi:hypothetical protein
MKPALDPTELGKIDVEVEVGEIAELLGPGVISSSRARPAPSFRRFHHVADTAPMAG